MDYLGDLLELLSGTLGVQTIAHFHPTLRWVLLDYLKLELYIWHLKANLVTHEEASKMFQPKDRQQP